MNEQIACEAAVQKHIVLHQAIESIDSVLSRLEGLIGRIEGPKPCDATSAENVKAHEPTLIDILNGGADSIQHKNNRAHDLIDGLEKLLF